MTRPKGSKNRAPRRDRTKRPASINPGSENPDPDDSAQLQAAPATAAADPAPPIEGATDPAPAEGGDDLLSQVVGKHAKGQKRPVGRPRTAVDVKAEAAKKKLSLDPELIEETAKASVAAQVALLCALFGPSFAPGYYDKDDESILIVGYRFWYRAYGIPFPPFAIFILCQVAYFGMRLGDPANRAAIKTAFDKLIKAKEKQEAAAAGKAAPKEKQDAAAPAATAPVAKPAAPVAEDLPANRLTVPADLPSGILIHPDAKIGGGQPFA